MGPRVPGADGGPAGIGFDSLPHVLLHGGSFCSSEMQAWGTLRARGAEGAVRKLGTVLHIQKSH